MPGTNPDRNVQLIEFAELHAQVWDGVTTRIGITSAQSASYKSAADAARQAYTEAQVIRQQAKVATERQNQAISVLRTTNSSLLKIIRGFAQDQADPAAVFQLAQIPAPAGPSPFVAPSTPFELDATLAITDGGIGLRWKASQPSNVTGVVYRVERQTGNGTTWTLVALTGTKNTIDTSVPVGTSRVIYRVIAQRGSLTSNASNPLEIRFGTGPGEMDVSKIKLAA